MAALESLGEFMPQTGEEKRKVSYALPQQGPAILLVFHYFLLTGISVHLARLIDVYILIAVGFEVVNSIVRQSID